MAAGTARSSLLCGWNLLVQRNLGVRAGVLWKQPPSRTFCSERKKFHTAPVGQVFRLRPFHVLVATGGGYAGYRKYEDYKVEQLEKRGIEVPVKLASEWEDLKNYSGIAVCVSVPGQVPTAALKKLTIAFDETALKDLVFTVEDHTKNFKLISRAPNAADPRRRH